MTYFIRQQGDRWLIYAGGHCVLDCDSEDIARATVDAANAALRAAAAGRKQRNFASRGPKSPEAPVVVPRCG
jgi:hypothetical protein